MGTITDFLGKETQLWACWSTRSIWTVLSVIWPDLCMVLCRARGWLNDPYSPFQLRIFFKSVLLWWKHCYWDVHSFPWCDQWVSHSFGHFGPKTFPTWWWVNDRLFLSYSKMKHTFKAFTALVVLKKNALRNRKRNWHF